MVSAKQAPISPAWPPVFHGRGCWSRSSSPNRNIAEGYHNENVFLKSGDIVVGRVLSETDTELNLLNADDGEITIALEDVNERRRGLSSMPTNVTESLSLREIRDLVEFLVTLTEEGTSNRSAEPEGGEAGGATEPGEAGESAEATGFERSGEPGGTTEAGKTGEATEEGGRENKKHKRKNGTRRR